MTSQNYTTFADDSYCFDSEPSFIEVPHATNDDAQRFPILSSQNTSSRPLLSHPFNSHQTTWPSTRKSPTLIEYESNDPIDTSAISTTYHQTNLQFDIDYPSSSACLPVPLNQINSKIYPIKGVPVAFPFTPYQAQVQMMSKIIEALQKKQHAVLESPTGSGKSLAMLCGTLAWLEKEKENRRLEDTARLEKLEKQAEDDTTIMNFVASTTMDEGQQDPKPKPLPKIYIGSRTHKQVAQLVKEIKQRSTYRPRMAVLGSRDQYCIHRDVMKSTNKQEDCAFLTDHHKCYHHHRSDKLVKDPRIRQGGRNEIWDIEDLTQLGKETGGCPYYASRAIAETAELIICPYNYLVDPMIRRAMAIDIDDDIIILDEAHNVENVSRESGTIELDSDILKFMVMELGQVIQGGYVVPAHEILQKLIVDILDWMYNESHHFESEDDNQRLHILSSGDEIKRTLDSYFKINGSTMASVFHPALGLVTKHADEMKTEERQNPEDMVTNIGIQQSPEDMEVDDEVNTQSQSRNRVTRTHVSATNLNRFEGLFMVLDYALDDSRNGIDDYRMVLMKRTDMSVSAGKNWDRRLGLWCMNPAVVFQDIANRAHSVILTSGTLTPVTTFEAELGTEFPIHLEANHVIKPSQVLVQNIPYGPNRNSLKGVYSTTSKSGYQDDLGEAIASICEVVPFGVLVFVTSYSLLDKLHTRWKATGLLDRITRKKHFVIEPRGGSAQSFDKVLKKFYTYIKEAENGMGVRDGAVFLAVYRGKVSEGIDFNNNNCRAVVATGIPYPMWKDTKVMLKRNYNDIRCRENDTYLTGDQWYNIQAFRAVNQALGRCIRHRNDWGSILLLEERFLDEKNTHRLSKWIRQLCISRTDKFETIMADLSDFNQGRLQLDLESRALLQQQNAEELDEPPNRTGLGLLDSDESSSERSSSVVVDYLSVSSMDTDVSGSQQQPNSNLDSSNDSKIEFHDALDEVISINSSAPGSPTTTGSPLPPSLSQPICTNYKISCKNCHRPLLAWPPLPVTASTITTNLHYFTNILEQQQQRTNETTEILEVLYVYCMDYEKRHDHNRVPAYDRMNAWKGEQVVQDVQWDSVDGIVYRPYVTECCNQAIGADIVTTMLRRFEANEDLMGKLWLLKDLVHVSICHDADSE